MNISNEQKDKLIELFYNYLMNDSDIYDRQRDLIEKSLLKKIFI